MLRGMIVAAAAAAYCAAASSQEHHRSRSMSEALTLMQDAPHLRERIERYLTDNNTMPQQTHLSVTPSTSEMQIMFVTNWLCAGSVSYAPATSADADAEGRTFGRILGSVVNTATGTYTAGLFGWNGTIHTATMTGLTPGTAYTYTACCDGSCGNATTFKQPPVPGADTSLYVGVTADMGTVQLFGYLVADRMIAEHRHGAGPTGQPFDLVVLAGDISYATVDPPKNEIEAFWDLFGVQAAGWAETAPAMYTVGNHEDVPGTVTDSSGKSSYSDYAAFSARYNMPGPATGGNGSFWYSWNQGPVHFISTSSEHPYLPGTPQYQWLQSDLAGVDRSTTPFVMLLTHRPILSAVTDEEGDHVPGGPRITAWEPLFRQYGVDVVIQGHQHVYERIHPNWNGSVVSTPSGSNNSYFNPGAPLYIVAANSGAVLQSSFISPLPAWEATNVCDKYGFGRMWVQGSSGSAGTSAGKGLRGSASSTSSSSSSGQPGGTIFFQLADTDGLVRDTWALVKN